MAHDPDSIIIGAFDPEDHDKPLTRARLIEILDEDLAGTAKFVADGIEHWQENHEVMHILAGLAALHNATHTLAAALTALAEHDQREQAIDEVIVEVKIPETVPSEWLA